MLHVNALTGENFAIIFGSGGGFSPTGVPQGGGRKSSVTLVGHCCK